MIEQRACDRASFRRSVMFGPDGASSSLGFAKDLSESGLFIMTSKTFSVGTRLTLLINDRGRVSKTSGVVARVESGSDGARRGLRCGLGIRFDRSLLPPGASRVDN